MMPWEYDEEIESDPRYGALIDQLDAFRISRDEAFYLHTWLSGRADDRVIEKAVADAIGTETIVEQVRVCIKLEKCASVIAEQFAFLRQVSSLEFSLAQAHSLTPQDNASCSQVPPNGGREEWLAFRARLEKDAGRLAQVAQRAMAEIKVRGDTRGRRPKEWRNSLFTELVDHLLQRSRQSQEASIDLAYWVWNIYFPREKIDSSDSVQKIVARERNLRKSKGQNTARS